MTAIQSRKSNDKLSSLHEYERSLLRKDAAVFSFGGAQIASGPLSQIYTPASKASVTVKETLQQRLQREFSNLTPKHHVNRRDVLQA